MIKQNVTVFIADDIELDRETLRRSILNKESKQHVFSNVVEAISGEDLITKIEDTNLCGPSIALIDVVLSPNDASKMDGFQTLHAMRENNFGMPAIILSSEKSRGYRENALNVNAMHFFDKGDNPQVLVSFMGNALRQYEQQFNAERWVGDVMLCRGVLSRRVFCDKKQRMQTKKSNLSNRPLSLLLYLLERKDGSYISQGELLTEVWNYTHDANTNVVAVAVKAIRKKFKEDLEAENPIETKKYLGYRLARYDSPN